MKICLFDQNGRCAQSLSAEAMFEDAKAEMLANGYVEVSEDDWAYYMGKNGQGDNETGYIRDTKTGKPVSAPAASIDNKALLQELDSEYKSALEVLQGSVALATLRDDATLLEELKKEYAELNEYYEQAKSEVEG